MPLNFGLLQPVDIGARFTAGQESVQRNQLAQQQRQQDQDMNALRMQQLRGAVSQQERQVKAETATQKTAMFRDRLQRARDPNAVRELVKMQYADPDLGPILSQTGTLEQALAEVPDDPAQFELHRQQEIMGMSEWMKSQLPKVVGGSIFNPATNTFNTPPENTSTPDSKLMQQLGYPLTQAGYQAFQDAQRSPGKTSSPEIILMEKLGYPLTPQGYQDFVNSKKPSTLRSPEEEKQAIRIARESRPPAQPTPLQPPVAVIGPNGKEIFVSREEALANRMTPASSSQGLKQIPANINLAILKNNQSLKQIDDTIALLNKNPNSTGVKGYLPNFALNRMDPEGTDARAGVADIGSLVLHDRSGAAVTAAEAPRLMPFIPLATDDNATVIKKLTRMRNIAAQDQVGLTETYSKDQGYIPSPILSATGLKVNGQPEINSSPLPSIPDQPPPGAVRRKKG